MKQGYKVAILIFFVLLLDQALKIYIKTHFEYNEERLLFGLSWARLHFVENEGMAFGLTFDWVYGKLVLSLFRILMVAGLIWYMRMLIVAKAPAGFVYSVGLITAGALGNIIDSAIYGLIFTSTVHSGAIAEMVPWGQGYGSFLHGRVVDMLYFPIHYFNLPGGYGFLFFSPIFNLADASITTGVLSILLFQRRFFRQELKSETPTPIVVFPSNDEPENGDQAIPFDAGEPADDEPTGNAENAGADSQPDESAQ
ncbi:MAG: lipoprotein signal peptidase [Bacteroidetes bacterium]|nr:lipoprotein signal peptidase [Bacteroidota bacterium]